MNDTPRRPAGSTAKLNFDRRNHDEIYYRARVVRTSSATVQRGLRGFQVSVNQPPRTRPALVELFQLMSIQEDYLTCRPVNVARDLTREVDDGDVYIAKEPKLRNSVTQEIIDGLTIDYTYDPDFTTRTASAEGMDDETQVVVPHWLVHEEYVNAGDLIFAVRTTGTGVWRLIPDSDPEAYEELTLLELSSRAWAKVTE